MLFDHSSAVGLRAEWLKSPKCLCANRITSRWRGRQSIIIYAFKNKLTKIKWPPRNPRLGGGGRHASSFPGKRSISTPITTFSRKSHVRHNQLTDRNLNGTANTRSEKGGDQRPLKTIKKVTFYRLYRHIFSFHSAHTCAGSADIINHDRKSRALENQPVIERY